MREKARLVFSEEEDIIRRREISPWKEVSDSFTLKKKNIAGG